MNNIIEQLNSKIGGELVKSERTVSSLTKQQKFINSINKEIEILTNRTDLILKKITKKDLKNKTESLVNEVRFWKKHSNPKLVFVTLKFKGKILLNNG